MSGEDKLWASPVGPPPATLFGSPMLTSPPLQDFRPFGGVPVYRSTPGTEPARPRTPSQSLLPGKGLALAGEYEDDFEGEGKGGGAAAAAEPEALRAPPRVLVTLEAPSPYTEPGVTRHVSSRPSSRSGLAASSRPASRGALAAPSPGFHRRAAAPSAEPAQYADDFESAGGGSGGGGGGAAPAAAPSALPSPSRALLIAQQVEARFHSPKGLPPGASPIAVLNAQQAGHLEPPTPRLAQPSPAAAPLDAPSASARVRETRDFVDASLANVVEARVRDRLKDSAAAAAKRTEAALAERSAQLREHYTVLLAAKDKSAKAVERRLKAASAECEALKQRLAAESVAGRVTALEANT